MTPEEVRAALHALRYEEMRDVVAGPYPMTWFPDLIGTMVERSLEAGVWQPGGVERFVAGVERRWREEHPE